MTGLTVSAGQLKQELESTLELLRQANRYVGTNTSIGAQQLSIRITEHIAAIRRREKSS
ncbi:MULTISPECIES: hypothetical protein [Pseudomonadaceae]|uniref:hypothetical protein n=1 Tax=Pseudomonadaceae TaxID=135621 RepID=UPI00192223B3|nr:MULTISPECIES: hypothetical protein [Pseudomonas]MDW3712897.1 hypothetical protein [Pseudomonas sp. 2023EL-01195]